METLNQKEDLNEVLNSQQINDIIKYINDNYNLDFYSSDFEIEGTFEGNQCVITFQTPELIYCGDHISEIYDSISHSILVDRKGGIKDFGYSRLKYFNDSLILYEKEIDDTIYNEKNSDYLRNYKQIIEQGVIDINGEIICNGDFGDIDEAQMEGEYLILQKNQYTQQDKDKITYAITNYPPKGPNMEICPHCESHVYWDTTINKYVCSNCERTYAGHHTDIVDCGWYLDPIELLKSTYYLEILKSSKVAHGQYIQDNPELALQYEEMDDPCISIWDEREPEPDYGFDLKVYSVFSISDKHFVIPFQSCQIFINPPKMSKGVYLANSHDLEYLEYGYRYRYEEDSNVCNEPYLIPNPYKKDKYVTLFKCQDFLSISDTFRTGKLVGQTLSTAFKTSPKDIIHLVSHNRIYITRDAMKQLQLKYGKSHPISFNKLVIARDLKYDFDDDKIYDSSDMVIIGEAAHYKKEPLLFGVVPVIDHSFYCEETIKEVFEQNPNYLIEIIYNCKIFTDEGILEGLDKNCTSYKMLVKAVEYNVCRQNEIEQEQYDDYHRFDDRDDIEQSNRDFDEMMDDFDAWGNID